MLPIIKAKNIEGHLEEYSYAYDESGRLITMKSTSGGIGFSGDIEVSFVEIKEYEYDSMKISSVLFICLNTMKEPETAGIIQECDANDNQMRRMQDEKCS